MVFVVFLSKLFLCSGHVASSNRPLSSKVRVWFALSSLTFLWWFLGTQTNLSDFLLTVQEIPCSDLAGLKTEERSELSTMSEWNAGLRVGKQCDTPVVWSSFSLCQTWPISGVVLCSILMLQRGNQQQLSFGDGWGQKLGNLQVDAGS